MVIKKLLEDDGIIYKTIRYTAGAFIGAGLTVSILTGCTSETDEIQYLNSEKELEYAQKIESEDIKKSFGAINTLLEYGVVENPSDEEAKNMVKEYLSNLEEEINMEFNRVISRGFSEFKKFRGPEEAVNYMSFNKVYDEIHQYTLDHYKP